MTEYQFMQKLMDLLPGHCQRIENATEPGLPDINWCVGGREMWLETKIHRGYTEIRKEQYGWGLKRARWGGRVLVVSLSYKFQQQEWYTRIYRFPDIQVLTDGEYEHPVIMSDPLVCITGKKQLVDFLLKAMR